MAIYWIISYTLLVFCIFELATVNQQSNVNLRWINNWLFLIAALGLIIFGGIRGPMSGLDDSQYLGFFHDFSSQLHVNDYARVSDIYRYEKLFMVLAWLLSFVTKESYYFLFFVCFIAVTTNAVCFKKYSPLMLCSLCLYSAHLFINKDMNQIRFGLCSCFGLVSICSAASRRYLIALVFFYLSTQSHSTGWVLLLFVPFLFIRERKFLPLLLVFAAIPLGLVGGKKLFLDSIGVVPDLGDRAVGYMGTTFDQASPVFGLANLKNILFILAFTFYYFKEGIQKNDRLAYLLIIAYSIGSAVRITFADFTILGGRVGNLFLHTEPLLLAMIMYRVRHLYINVAILFTVTSYYLVYNTVITVQAIRGYSVAPLFHLF